MSVQVPVSIGTIEDVAAGRIPGGYTSVNALQGESLLHGLAGVFDRAGGILRLRVDRGDSGGTVVVSISGDDLSAAENLAGAFRGFESDGPGWRNERGLELARKVAATDGPVLCQLDGAR